ncbi:MAG: helix-hairpin-helix domain-containing protein [Lachnospiraceae bacterium]|nr:helix-hairpin-helix domain-containing protein [Lachnospiraceae bacterium]
MRLYKENKLNIIAKYKRSLVTVTGLILSLLFLSLFASCKSRDDGLVAVYEDETVASDLSDDVTDGETEREGESATETESETETVTLQVDDGSIDTDSAVIKDIKVYVCGAVQRPDVYEISADSRIVDAVSAAGGFAIDAYPEAMNLAETVSDGSRIYVPTKEEVDALAVVYSDTGSGSGDTTSDSTGRVNINTATLEELTTLPGIGDTRARAIIDYREQNGAFGNIEEIMQVTGIKEKSFSKIKDSICVK